MFAPRRTYSLESKSRRKRKSSSQNSLAFLYLGCLALASLVVVGLLFWVVSPLSENHDSKNKVLRAASEGEWDWPLVHIVNTRFMQEQGHLVTLAKARLELFVAFCLPTMVHQTSKEFLWIIKVDPSLNLQVRNEMVEYLRDYPNFFLVGSNKSYQVGSGEEGTWRDGVQGTDVLSSPIYSGDVRLLERAYAARNTEIVLETRLDADDGIHSAFIKSVQETALNSFSDHEEIQWLYWCSRRHLEWFPDTAIPEGRLNPVKNSKFCITPGLTVGFGVGARDVPQYSHDKLYEEVEATGGCGLSKNIDCIHMIKKRPAVAIRSRTLTSAGMKDTVLDPELHRGKNFNRKMWNMLENDFFLSPEAAERASTYMKTNVKQIAKENLQGQCTSRHSCKLKSVEQLQKLMEVDTEGQKLETVEYPQQAA